MLVTGFGLRLGCRESTMADRWNKVKLLPKRLVNSVFR